jgi:hypothetical protein
MKTYRVYGEYIQRVYIDVVALDSEYAQDLAASTPVTEWALECKQTEIDITGVDYA